MERFAQQLRVAAAALMLSVLLAFALGGADAAASTCAGDVVTMQHMSAAHGACQPGSCAGHAAEGCCATSASCCQAGCAALLAPEPANLGRLPAGAWPAGAVPPLSGIDPFVNRHPPRHLG